MNISFSNVELDKHLPRCARFKPTVCGKSNTLYSEVYATDRGWCVLHLRNGFEEILVESRKLLTRMLELGYDKFGIKLPRTHYSAVKALPEDYELPEPKMALQIRYVAGQTVGNYLIPVEPKSEPKPEPLEVKEVVQPKLTAASLKKLSGKEINALAEDNGVEAKNKTGKIKELIELLGL